MTTDKTHFIESLSDLLQLRGIKKSHYYEWLKYPGSSKSDLNFIASICYFNYGDKIGVILVPYQRAQKSKDGSPRETSRDNKDSEMVFLGDTTRDQTGITLMTCYSKPVHHREISSKHDQALVHVQDFYANWLPLKVISKLLHFEGRNPKYPEKASPMGFELMEVIAFMPTSHLEATSSFLDYLLNNPEDPLFWKNSKINIEALKDYLYDCKSLAEEILSTREY